MLFEHHLWARNRCLPLWLERKDQRNQQGAARRSCRTEAPLCFGGSDANCANRSITSQQSNSWRERSFIMRPLMGMRKRLVAALLSLRFGRLGERLRWMSSGSSVSISFVCLLSHPETDWPEWPFDGRLGGSPGVHGWRTRLNRMQRLPFMSLQTPPHLPPLPQLNTCPITQGRLCRRHALASGGGG